MRDSNTDKIDSNLDGPAAWDKVVVEAGNSSVGCEDAAGGPGGPSFASLSLMGAWDGNKKVFVLHC